MTFSTIRQFVGQEPHAPAMYKYRIGGIVGVLTYLATALIALISQSW
jgi:hypothetical protein